MDQSVINRIVARLRQANTWLIVAILALSGWTVDALRMFLAMHPTPQAGLGAFASHFWYALPVLAAILILNRLHRQSRLLALTVYDETGRAVQHAGDFRLDEAITQAMLTSFKGGIQGDGLHHLDLLSGARVYFLHEGGRTVLACFSAPATADQVSRQIEYAPDAVGGVYDLLDGLPPEVAAVAANVIGRTAEQEVLSFFRQHSQTAITADDLAHWTCQPTISIENALDRLRRLRLVQRQHLGGQTFYRLSQDERCRGCLEQLFTWQDRWRAQARRVEELVGRGTIRRKESAWAQHNLTI